MYTPVQDDDTTIDRDPDPVRLQTRLTRNPILEFGENRGIGRSVYGWTGAPQPTATGADGQKHQEYSSDPPTVTLNN